MFKPMISWSLKSFPDLPWRQGRTLYTTLVSEIMLQQTTVGTVIKHFKPFLKTYPSIKKLAAASEEQVLKSWTGLGYYRRARNLHAAAKDIVANHKGKIPTDFETLKSIPGIGDYTANAILSIGADQRALPIDANIERIVCRLYGIQKEKGPKLQKELASLFNEGEVFPQSKTKSISFRELAEALMDVGREFCQANRADCEACPLQKNCTAYKNGNPLAYPKVSEKKKKEKALELELLRVMVKKGNKILAYQKNKSEWLCGQMEIPTLVVKSDDKKLTQYPSLKKDFDVKKLVSFKTGITKYKIKNYIVEMSPSEFKNLKLEGIDQSRYQFIPFDLEAENFSTTSKKVFERC